MLQSGLEDVIGDEESLARLLTQSGHFNTAGVRHTVFLPHKTDRETSVYRHSGNPSDELWAIATANSNGRKFYGAGIFKAKVARAQLLEVVADEPPDRHAVLRDWPFNDTDPEMEKGRHKEIAMALARDADLLLASSV